MIQSRLTGSRKSLPKGAKMVLEALTAAREILSAKELAFRMRLMNPTAAPGLTTVYRSLELLTRLGLTQEVLLSSEEKRFEVVNPGGHHHHLVCKSCGQHTKLSQCLLTGEQSGGQNFSELVKNQYGFAVTSHVLEIFGTCKQCTARESQTQEDQPERSLSLAAR